jgi:Na+/melibiose symporter-like transporter
MVESMSQLRQLRAVYAGGVVAWTLCLLLTLVQENGSARQIVVLLGLLAVFLVLLLWSTWCLWEAGTRRPADRMAGTANARFE